MSRHLPWAALVIVTLVCCKGPQRAAAWDTGVVADSATVDATTNAFHQSLRANDLEKFMSYVAEDVFFMPPGEPPIRGRDSMRKWTASFLAQYRTSSLTLSDREVRVGDRWAVELGTFAWTLQPVAGGAAIVDRGNYMQLWKREGDGKWRFAREIYNSSVPPEPSVAK